MISLTDYLYSGDTVLKILHNYSRDLLAENTPADTIHAEYLDGIIQLLQHNDFLTSQSQRIREFYKYMADRYPYLAFTFKGRIKSLLRSEEKFNRNLMEVTEEMAVSDVVKEDLLLFQNPETLAMMKEKVLDIRDVIAYRIVISVPKCHVPEGKDPEELAVDALYEIAEVLPGFLENLDFTVEIPETARKSRSSRLSEGVRDYYKDYVEHPTILGYRALHIVFFDKVANCKFEIQLRTKLMDDNAEIGSAAHDVYEEIQKKSKTNQELSKGIYPYYDDAYERLLQLKNLDLSTLDVNMFAAAKNRINDGCGLYYSRLILPYEHLSRFQNDLID